ncbi:30S ribosomal protein S3 [candidate division WOR-3 bacterium]|nr:30S ribosomal protein S3 [candidate division WOR-3 bacterium]
MGQKVHPYGFRLGYIKEWQSQWFDEMHYAEYLAEDIRIKRYIYTKLADAAVSNVMVRRVGSKIAVTISTARPGMVIGQKRSNLEALSEELNQLVGKPVNIYVEVVRVPELESRIVARTIASQLEGRVAHRRAMRRAVTQAMKLGARGIKVGVSGRLGGAEIARREWYKEGQVPLQTLAADIDYAEETAYTMAGTIGVKVWIYKGGLIETWRR